MLRRAVLFALVALVSLVLTGTAIAAYTTVARNPFTGVSAARPATFTLAQDGSIGLTKLKWVGWGSGTATGIGVDVYRLWPAFKFARASGTIQLTRRTICNDKIYYARAIATVTGTSYNRPKPSVRAETLSILPSGC